MGITSILIFFLSCLDHAEQDIIAVESIDLNCVSMAGMSDRSVIVNNNDQYQKLLQNRLANVACSNYELPRINFENSTLIGFNSVVVGCKKPEISSLVTKKGGDYLIEIFVDQKGHCKMGHFISLWQVLPKTQDESKLSFKVHTTTLKQ